MNTGKKARRKLPIGVQSFAKLRSDHYIYVDKSEYIFRLVQSGSQYFLSRPRRFGKSLLLSTLRAFWEGKKELFSGLAIEKYFSDNPDAWQPYPVFYFDFNKDNYELENSLERILDEHLREWEQQYNIEPTETALSGRFRQLLKKAFQQTGKKAVVLVDEYDKPLLDTIQNELMEERNKAVFKGFFSTLKSYDEYLEFVFLTGVTKFSKISIFSDLNHLQDISMDKDYNAICGITEEELKTEFTPEIEAMAKELKITDSECLARLKAMYDGYHFHPESAGVYNPFSLINALQKREFGTFWFSTGTPTFLIKKLEEIDFDAKKFTDGSIYADGSILSDYRADNPDPLPLFYQTGYLTIKDYDKKYRSYLLSYPNDEVKYSFIESLAPSYLHSKKGDAPLNIRSFGLDLENAHLNDLKDRFTELFARLPYSTDDRPLEQNFQNVIYIVFMLLGQFVHTEIHSAKGRADCIVETDRYVYLFEFKRDQSADAALTQIEEKGYAKTYAADNRTLYRIGISFDSAERNIAEWKVMS